MHCERLLPPDVGFAFRVGATAPGIALGVRPPVAQKQSFIIRGGVALPSIVVHSAGLMRFVIIPVLVVVVAIVVVVVVSGANRRWTDVVVWPLGA